MTDHTNRGEDHETPADHNVRRLLSEAYVPEDPPAAFRDRERAALRSLAADLAKQRAGAPAASAPTPAPVEPAPIVRPDFGWRWALVAAVFLFGFALLLQLGRAPEATSSSDSATLKREGPLVWIDGKAYVLRDDAKTGEAVLVPQPDEPGAKAAPPAAADLEGVRPRKATPAKEAPLVHAGQTVRTDDGARRVRLKDGSILYVDRGSVLTVTGHRAVRLDRGRLFVEVSPRAGNDPGATFTVRTAGREVRALGTKFAVAADALRATEVLVTQGAVKVSGLADALRAGWKLSEGSAGEAEVKPLSRMSHELDWTRDLIKESETPLVPGSKHAGGALIAVDPYGQETRLTLRDYTVDVEIQDGFARTTIDQTYFNHQHWRMEGTFYFPLPPGASISRLAMYVNGTRMEGGMAERNHARSVFEEIRHTRRDPALLEWLDGSTFKMRVFPLEGRQEKRIVLSYVQRLESAYGKTTYRFPSGHSLGVVGKLSYRVRVKGHGERGWASPSHDLVAKPAAGDLEVGLDRERALMKDDLVLQLDDPTTKVTRRPRWTQIVRDGKRYLMLRTRPDLSGSAKRGEDARKKTFLFLFESSGDRDPLLARTQVEVVKTFLDNAEHSDEFTILTAGTRLRAFSKAPRPVVPSAVHEATAFLDKTHLIGALDLGNAFAALKPLVDAAKRRGREPVVVHVGSGIPALQEREQRELVAAVPGGARYVGVGVGKRWGRSLMKAAAAKTGGVYARINPDEEVRWRAYEVFSLLRTPTLTDLAVAVPGGKDARFLLADEVVHHGGEVCAVAQLPASAPLPEQLVLTGKRDGAAFSETIPVTGVADRAGYLPRFWALLELDRLVADGAKKHREEIVKLSMKSYVMSPFTSLLVLETEEMYKRFKVDRGRTDHWAAYECPTKIPVVTEPDPRAPSATVTTAGERAPREKVLETLVVRVPAALLHHPSRPYYHGRRLVTVKQLLAGGANGVGWVDFELSSGGFGRWGSWAQRWHDPTGAHGMTRWARRNGLLTPGRRQLALSGDLGASLEKAKARRVLSLEQQSREEVFRDRITVTDGTLRAASGLARAEPMVVFGSTAKLIDALGDESLGFRSSLAGEGLFSLTPATRGLSLGGRAGYYRSHANPLFQAPYFSHNLHATSDLLAFAPALNTSRDDAAVVLRAEARLDPRAALGAIDPRAAALIAAAREVGWTSIRVPAGRQGAAFELVFDGRGRFAWDRVNASGLREVAVCDGKTLVHTYPELGLGARRVWSPARWLRLQRFAPWALAPARELARGRDLSLSAPRTVALTERGVDRKKPYRQLELVFGADGQVALRRVVTIAPDGGRKVHATTDLAALRAKRNPTAARAPNLHAQTRGLVVLPLPFRSIAQTKARLLAKLGKATFDRGVGAWPEEDALAWTAAHINNAGVLLQIAKARFAAKQDRPIGFYVLVVAAGGSWTDSDRLARFSADLGPVSDLDLFLDGARRMHRRWDWYTLYQRSVAGFEKAPALIRDLARLQHVVAGHQSGRIRNAKTPAQRKALGLQLLGWAEEARDPRIAWAMVQYVAHSGMLPHTERRRIDALDRIYARLSESYPQLGYAARYRRATVWAGRDRARARRMFTELYAETLKRGGLPRIDHQFVSALNATTNGFVTFVRETARGLAGTKRHAQLPTLAWQCWQLGQRPAANEVLDQALGTIPSEQATTTMLQAVQVLWRINRLPHAARVLERLQRTQPKAADQPAVWRMVAAVAQRRGRSAKAVEALERALELQYAELPPIINLQTVRTDYGQLLAHYLKVAHALATLEQKPPQRFVARVIKFADRWRAIDPQPTGACQAAAQVLQTLGAKALAWDYLTTPVAKSPNEAAPWVALARLAQSWDDVDLADRSYANAFAAEETNAQILWDHAQVLQQSGQTSKARALYRKLADGAWQPRFQWLKQQAKAYLGG